MKPKTGIESPNFKLLCDLVAANALVVVTGAGVSVGLKHRYSGRTLPNWIDLLKRLQKQFSDKLDKQSRIDSSRILNTANPTAPQLIEVASIIRNAVPRQFEVRLRREVTPIKGVSSDKHDAILELMPRGIITFNYDDGHENAAEKRKIALTPLLPDDEDDFVNMITSKFANPFLLKAHGCIRRKEGELVLSSESYRDLLVKRPAYRAFVQNILTNFHLLILGFGLSDPDFNLFLENVASSFGSPLNRHIAIFHIKEYSAREIELRRRYGIDILYVSDWNEIAPLLKAAAKVPGPKLLKTINKCLSKKIHNRHKGHIEVSELSQVGKKCMNEFLLEE